MVSSTFHCHRVLAVSLGKQTKILVDRLNPELNFQWVWIALSQVFLVVDDTVVSRLHLHVFLVHKTKLTAPNGLFSSLFVSGQS